MSVWSVRVVKEEISVFAPSGERAKRSCSFFSGAVARRVLPIFA